MDNFLFILPPISPYVRIITQIFGENVLSMKPVHVSNPPTTVVNLQPNLFDSTLATGPLVNQEVFMHKSKVKVEQKVTFCKLIKSQIICIIESGKCQ